MKIKITRTGQPCRKCGTPVIKKIPKRKRLKPNQTYFFNYYFYCKNCRTLYMVESQKVFTSVQNNNKQKPLL